MPAVWRRKKLVYLCLLKSDTVNHLFTPFTEDLLGAKRCAPRTALRVTEERSQGVKGAPLTPRGHIPGRGAMTASGSLQQTPRSAGLDCSWVVKEQAQRECGHLGEWPVAAWTLLSFYFLKAQGPLGINQSAGVYWRPEHRTKGHLL